LLLRQWDDCMPTQPAPGVQPEDGLVHWMMAHAGRPGGYLARPDWDDRSQDWDPGTHIDDAVRSAVDVPTHHARHQTAALTCAPPALVLS